MLVYPISIILEYNLKTLAINDVFFLSDVITKSYPEIELAIDFQADRG